MKCSQSCPIHGSDLKPRVCNDCARLTPTDRLLRLTDTMVGQLERFIDERGRVAFRAVRPIKAPETRLQPWGATWD